jgi:vacuolar-type H+-ATPase subunit E/Vma4
MSDNPEITRKIEENTEKLIKDILADQKKAIAEISKETEEKIKGIQGKIVEEAKTKADSEFLREKAKKELELKLQITKYRDDLVSDLIDKAKEKISTLIGSKEYEKSLEKLVLEAALTLKQPEISILCRKEDKDIFSKQFFDNVSKQITDKELKVKFNVSNNFIKTMGGVKLETVDGRISIDNTYEKRIERSLDDLKRELSLLITQEG